MRSECWLQSYLNEHPEIESVGLLWLWPFRAIVPESIGLGIEDSVQIASGL